MDKKWVAEKRADCDVLMLMSFSSSLIGQSQMLFMEYFRGWGWAEQYAKCQDSGTAQSKPRHPNSVKERHCHQPFFPVGCWQSWQQLACWDFSGKVDISKSAVNDMCVATSTCHRFKIPSCPLVTFMRWGGQSFPYRFLSSCAAFSEKWSEHRSPVFFFKLAIFIHVS